MQPLAYVVRVFFGIIYGFFDKFSKKDGKTLDIAPKSLDKLTRFPYNTIKSTYGRKINAAGIPCI